MPNLRLQAVLFPTFSVEVRISPARFTPYTEKKCAADGKTWWFNSDYALGFIAGWGVHPLDIALWGHPAMFNGTMALDGTELGAGFQLREQVDEIHVTPWSMEQRFSFFRFTRAGTAPS